MTEDDDHEPQEFRLVEVKLPPEAYGPASNPHDGVGIRNGVESH